MFNLIYGNTIWGGGASAVAQTIPNENSDNKEEREEIKRLERKQSFFEEILSIHRITNSETQCDATVVKIITQVSRALMETIDEIHLKKKMLSPNRR